MTKVNDLRKKKMGLKEWSSLRAELNPIEMLPNGFKKAIRHSTNLCELAAL